ncbi:uncharacterized protein G2W53_029549 [Senna tora]|uniref:Uncharacterized protein n=1 Tax=Senna tora TaxID=362788 RepID=A0A834T5U2_9FABA|nr:uncharacterized protein G2W53_029549 [Senna tora]
MDESEFRRVLQLFPVVRSRDYCVRLSLSLLFSSCLGFIVLWEWQDAWDDKDREIEIQGAEQHDAVWSKIKSVAERKVGAEEAERFCKAFQQIHKKLVREGLTPDAARNFINSS